MSAGTVRLSTEIERAIRRHAEEGYPYEICGALIGVTQGETWRIARHLPAPNEHEDDRRRRYRIPPEFQLAAEREARAEGLDVVGYYHSHPDHPARPSEYDRSHAWPGYAYVICSVRGGASEDLTAWGLEEADHAFGPLALAAGDGGPA